MISVICPTYNRSAAIVDTIASVVAQSEPDWELLVVSDGSTDDTERHASSVDDPRVRVLRTARHGHPSGPRNAGLAAARGEFVAYLDHDDQWTPNHLTVLLAAFADGADLVATGFRRLDAAGAELSRSQPLPMHWHPETALLAPQFEPSRVTHRAGLAEQVGGWRTTPGLEDWDLWVRLADAGHRFTTVIDATAVLFEDPGTRINRTVRRHHLPLAGFADPGEAARACARLRATPATNELREACRNDLRRWYRRLASDDLRAPRGWHGDLDSEIDALCAAMVKPPWTDLAVRPVAGEYVVCQPLWCAGAEHAARVRALAEDVHREQFALARRIVEDLT